MTPELRGVGVVQSICVTGVSWNRASYDCFLVEKSHVAFWIFRGTLSRVSTCYQMISVQMQLHHQQFVVEWQLRPGNQSSSICYPSRRSSQPNFSISAAIIHQASCALLESSLCDAVLYWRLYPLPSRVDHRCWACHSGLSIHIIHDPFLFHFVFYQVCFSSLLCCKLLFRSQAAQWSKGADRFCIQAALASPRLMTTSFHALWWFALFAYQ